jgi:DNA-binding MarR family transcriptional regulator
VISDPATPRDSLPAVSGLVLLSRANALVGRALGRALAPWGISWPQLLGLLILVEQAQPISATRLVEHLGLGRTAMTSVVDRLERGGWVERRASSSDRRVSHLVVTDAGRKILADTRPVVVAAAERAFAGFAAADLTAWYTSIERLNASLHNGSGDVDLDDMRG